MVNIKFIKPDLLLFCMVNPKIDISNLNRCVENVRNAILEGDPGLQDPTNYSQLRGRLETARNSLPPLYRDAFFLPFVEHLDKLGESGFTAILTADVKREREAGLLFDIAHVILQNAEGYNWIATDSFQEVVSDLYDGFLSSEDRRGISPPDRGTIPPLVKWGKPDSGPYTWPIDATSIFNLKAAIVNLPPSFAKSGLFAWAALGHETAGHDIIHADTNLHNQLSRAVQDALEQEGFKNSLPSYWGRRIDETTSDILGILNMGPSVGLGLIGYFRGISVARGGKPKLRNTGGIGPHPAMILRGYLAASTIRLLSFEGAEEWSNLVEEESKKDLETIELEGIKMKSEDAIRSAKIVAETISKTKLNSLENHSLLEIQNWRDHDQTIVKETLTPVFKNPAVSASDIPDDVYAAHVVAAAIESAVTRDGNIGLIHNTMLRILKIMHDLNPSWGPLFVMHPGNISRHLMNNSSS